MDTTVLGEQIQKYRKQRGLTQKELGAAVGVSTQAVSQWECGGAPDVALLPAIADRLGVTVDALFGREGGAVRDVPGTLLRWLRTLPGSERLARLARLLWEAAIYSVNDGLAWIPKIDYPETGEMEMPAFGQEPFWMRTVTGNDSGYSWAWGRGILPLWACFRSRRTAMKNTCCPMKTTARCSAHWPCRARWNCCAGLAAAA